MHAYLLRSERVIDPFGPVADVLIRNRRLADLQGDAFRKLGLQPRLISRVEEIRDDGELVLVEDSIFFTERFLRIFLDQARKQGKPCQCHINAELFNPVADMTTYMSGGSEEPIGIFYYPSGVSQTAPCSMPDLLDYDITYGDVPYFLFGQPTVSYLCSRSIAISIDNWADVINANIYANRKAIADITRTPSKIARGIIRSHSLNKHAILGKNNLIGVGCDIHPSAIIEGCEIGDNVTVMANTHLVASTVGDNAIVGSGSVIQFSSVGASCLLFAPTLLYSTVYDHSFIGRNMVINSLVGSNVQLSVNTTISDHRMSASTIPIRMGRRKIPTRYRWLGACFGDGCKVSASVQFMEGLTVPPDLEIHSPDGLSFISPDTPSNVPLIVQNKGLRPIRLLAGTAKGVRA